jgi:hypothetical protein
MARSTHTIYDTTGTSAGAVSTGVLDASDYDEITVWFIGAGAAAPTGCSVTPCDVAGTALPAVSVTVAIAGKSPAVFGAVPASGVTNAVALGPVTPKFSATGTGGAASTVRILVHGVRYRFGAN